MTDIAEVEKTVINGLTAILQEKGYKLFDTGIDEGLRGIFKVLNDGRYKLAADDQALKYRLRVALSLAAGFPAGDKLAMVKVISLKKVMTDTKTDDVATALDTLMFGSTAIKPLYATDGLFSQQGQSLDQIEAELISQITDANIVDRVKFLANVTLGDPLRAALTASFGESAGSLFADTTLNQLRAAVYAALTRKSDLLRQTVASLKIAPGAVLLGCPAEEKRSVKNAAPCYVLAQ